jgi:hypothetical protein
VYYQYAILSQYTGTGDVGPARSWLPATRLAVREVVALARTWLLQQLRPSSTPMPSTSASIAAATTAPAVTAAAAEGEARLLRAAFAFEQCAICGESIEFSPLSDDYEGEGDVGGQGGEGDEVGEKAAIGGAVGAAAGVNGMSKLRYRTPFKEVGRSLLYGVCRTGCQVRWDRCCYSHLLITSNPVPASPPATAAEVPPEELEGNSSVTGAGATPLTSGTGSVMGNNGSGDIQATTLFGCSVCGSATNLAILSALQGHHMFDPFPPLCCPFCAVQMQLL